MRGARAAARHSPDFSKAISARASFIAGLIGTTLLAGSAFAQGIVLTNASLIDGNGGAPQRGVTIVFSLIR